MVHTKTPIAIYSVEDVQVLQAPLSIGENWNVDLISFTLSVLDILLIFPMQN